MMRFKTATRMMVHALVLAALTSLAFAATGYAQSTEQVWQHHIQAWEKQDLSEIVADYDTESVLILNNRIFKGRDAISSVFAQLFRIFDGGSNRIDTPVIVDRYVYITWHFTPTGHQEFFGTDTFVIEDGKIVLQTIASPLYEVFPVTR
jgi:hypothetical protein